MSEEVAASVTGAQRTEGAGTWVAIGGLVYLLLVGVGTIGLGFKWVSGGAEGAAALFAFANNPLVGVVVGVLATALVQSSSTVTSVIVGLVAGGVPVSLAVPMIMGANMGTTITNTIVSLGNLREREAFGRSFEAATVHDFFNLFTILLLLPLEVALHPLENSALYLATFLSGSGAGIGGFDPVGALTGPPAALLKHWLQGLPEPWGGVLLITLGIAMIMVSVLWLGRLLRRAMTGRAKHVVDRAIGRGRGVGVLSGAAVTVMVQSSSTTTSLVVPLAGAGVLSTRQIYPFTLGANIGTCITALLAATAVSGENGVFALEIALVHLLYNTTGVGAFLLVPGLRELPIRAAQALGRRVIAHRGWALVYLGGVFLLLPGLVLGGQVLLSR